MSMMKFLNQKGMTLVEVMIGAAIMGGIALVSAKLMGDQIANQNHLKTMADINGMVTKIESMIKNPAVCKEMFFGRFVNGVQGTATDNENLFTYTRPGFAGQTLTLVAEGNYQTFRIPNNSVKLEQSRYGAAATAVNPTTVADLVIDFQATHTGLFAAKRGNIQRRIPFVVQIDKTGLPTLRITDCGPVLQDANTSARETMCLSLGGAATWDSTAGTCKLSTKMKCPYGQVATKFTSLGQAICEPIQGQLNLNEIFDFTPKNCVGKPKLKIIKVGQKFQIDCTI